MKMIRIVLPIMLVFSLLLSACNSSVSSPKTAIVPTSSPINSSKIVKPTPSARMSVESFKALSAIIDVIQNNKEFICTENTQSIHLNDFHSDNYLIINDNGLNEYTSGNLHVNYVFKRFCVIDIDGDGNTEILLESKSSNILLFRYENGLVYGFVFPYRGMLNLKTDGTVEGSGGAAVQWIGKKSFMKNKCIDKELSLFDGLNNIYRIDGKNVKQEDVENFLNIQDKKVNAEWKLYSLNNIKNYELMVSKNVIVYITPAEKKYHLKGCKYLDMHSPVTTLEKAEKFFSPCNVCNPPS